jgi:hypothetical protein
MGDDLLRIQIYISKYKYKWLHFFIACGKGLLYK